MNRRRTLLTASLLTLAFGAAPATVWVFRHRSSFGGRSPSRDLPLTSAQVVSAAEQQTDAGRLDKVFTKENRLSYKGYLVEKSKVAGDEVWVATLKRGNRVLVKFENGGEQDYWTNFGLYSFLGADPKQLIVEQYSGGAHCCYSHWVYDLSATSPRLVFSNEKYGTGSALLPIDIDGDGVSEFTQSVMAFDYFQVSHASSVFPEAVFAYDKKAQEYRPANRRFAAYVLRDLEDDIKALAKIKAGGNQQDEFYSESHFSAVLQVTLKYIYAGRREEGWSFFEREYRTHEGISREKMRAEIAKTLQEEPVYNYIYSRDSE
jgi:hypothetical protein